MLPYQCLLILAVCARFLCGLDNGLARTPPMGWLSWARFGCNTNCGDDPDNCIGERLIRRTVDALVAGGFRDAGYEYVCLDDCWPSRERDADGRLQVDPERFPNGIKALADYVHSKGLKFGLYEDVGRHTCGGWPGSQDHLEIDAQTFAEWGVDMLKFDGCNTDGAHRDYGYPQMAKYLNATGRPILYYCEWPIYPWEPGHEVDLQLVADACNMFRIYGDTYDNFQSVKSILEYYGRYSKNFTSVAGPGHWNDADQITIGNFGQSVDQSRIQMGMWAIIASPMLMSVNVATMPQYAKDLYLNTRIIDISQDKLGIQGQRMLTWGEKDSLQIWTRPISPVGSFAVAFLCFYEHGYPIRMSVNLRDLNMFNAEGYNITEVFDGTHLGIWKPPQNLTYHVNPTGIYMIRATVLHTRNIKLNGYDSGERKDEQLVLE